MRGTTLDEALRGSSPLKGSLEASARVSSSALRGSAGFCGGSRDFLRVVTLLVGAGKTFASHQSQTEGSLVPALLVEGPE